MRALAVVPLVAVASMASVRAMSQAPAASGWSAQERVIPNPLPNGRCAGITMEFHDQDGYRVNALSNGDAADSRRFTYSNSNPGAFEWRDGDSTQALICAKADAPKSSRATVTVTTPDGLSDHVDLTNQVPGQSVVAVVYTKQAPIRLPGSPPRYIPAGSIGAATVAATPSRSAAAPGGAASGGAASAGSAPAGAGATERVTPTSHTISNAAVSAPAGAGHLVTTNYVPAPVAISSPTLSGTGSWFSPPPVTLTTSALVGDGGFWLPPPVVLTASAMRATGNAGASPVALRKSDDAPFVPAPVVVTAPVLQAEGTVYSPGSVTATAPALSASGTYYVPPNVQLTAPTMQAVGSTPP